VSCRGGEGLSLAVYSTFLDCTSILLFQLSEKGSLPHPQTVIHHLGAKYDHFALKYDECSSP